MHPPNPQAGGGITAEDLLRAVASLGTQQHALQQQEVQKLPAHLLSLVALACGADDPASAALDHLSEFWQGFIPLRPKRAADLRTFVEQFLSTHHVPNHNVDIAVSTRMLTALKDCAFGGSLDFADRFAGLSPFSIVAPKLVSNWAASRQSMAAMEAVSQPTSADHLALASQTPQTKLPMSDSELMFMVETLSSFLQKVFGPACPLIVPLLGLLRALRSHCSHFQLSPRQVACTVWRLHLAMRKFFNREDCQAHMLHTLVSAFETLSDIPSDHVPPEMFLHAALPLPPAPSFVPPPTAPKPPGPAQVQRQHNTSAAGLQFAQIFAAAKAKFPAATLTALFATTPKPPHATFQEVLGTPFCNLCGPQGPCGRFHLLGPCPEGSSCTKGVHHLRVPPPDQVVLPALARFQQVVDHFLAHHRPAKKPKN